MEPEAFKIYVITSTKEGSQPATYEDKVTAVQKACEVANYSTMNDVHPPVFVIEVTVQEKPLEDPQKPGSRKCRWQSQARVVVEL